MSQRSGRRPSVRLNLTDIEDDHVCAVVLIQRAYRALRQRRAGALSGTSSAPPPSPQTAGVEGSLKQYSDVYVATDALSTGRSADYNSLPGVARIAVADRDQARLNTALQRLQLNVQHLCDDVPPRRGLPYVRTGPPQQASRRQDRTSLSAVQTEHEKNDNKSELFSETVPFRLCVVLGRRVPTAPRSHSPRTLISDKKRQADEVRRMKKTNHEESSRTTDVPRRRSEGDPGGAPSRRLRHPTSDAAAWLASLQSVATENRRAKAEERSAELRETVRLRREAREDARTVASSELDRQRMRSAFAEQKDRRALWSALERRASARRQAAVSILEARRRAAELTSARRQQVAFADNVARRIGACSQAHVRFVQQEHQAFRRQLAATGIQRLIDERRQRNAELERVEEARRRAKATQADTDRYRYKANRARLQQLTHKQTEARGVMAAKRSASALASVPGGQRKQPLQLPIISNT